VNKLISVATLATTFIKVKAEARLHNILQLIPYLKQKTTRHHNKHEFVNVAQGNNP
jgi:hypothetical protein